MPRTVRISSQKEYDEIVNFLKGEDSIRNPAKRLSMKRKCRGLSLKKGIDSLVVAFNSKEIIGEHDANRKLAILKVCHDDMDHPGRELTYERIYKNYIGIRKTDVTNYIRQCKECTQRRCIEGYQSPLIEDFGGTNESGNDSGSESLPTYYYQQPLPLNPPPVLFSHPKSTSSPKHSLPSISSTFSNIPTLSRKTPFFGRNTSSPKYPTSYHPYRRS